jgi:hypothetical protein
VCGGGIARPKSQTYNTVLCGFLCCHRCKTSVHKTANLLGGSDERRGGQTNIANQWSLVSQHWDFLLLFIYRLTDLREEKGKERKGRGRGGLTWEVRDWIERARPKSQTFTRQSELSSMFENFTNSETSGTLGIGPREIVESLVACWKVSFISLRERGGEREREKVNRAKLSPRE